MIEFGKEKFGHPWHGLWRLSTGKITTPSGGDIDTPGTPPEGSQPVDLARHGGINVPYGYCYKVQVPDAPAVTTTESEAAAGMTWTNYAVMSGLTRRLYGKPIYSWIYIAPNGTRWGVQFAYDEQSYIDKVLKVSLTFERFGEFLGVAETYYSGQKIVNLNVGTGLTSGAGFFSIDDVKTDGSGFLISGFVFKTNGDVRKRICHSVCELTISGNLPGATVNLTQIASELTDAHSTMTITASYKYLHYKYNYTTLTYDLFNTFYSASGSEQTPQGEPNIVYPVAESYVVDQVEIIGARYSSAGVAQIMKVKRLLNESLTGSMDPAGTSPTQFSKTPRAAISSSRTSSGSVSLLAGAAELFRVDMSGSSNISGFENPGGSPEYPANNDSSYTTSWTFGDHTVNDSGVAEGGVAPFFPFWNNIQRIFGWRYSNTVFGLVGVWNGAPMPNWGWYFPAIGRGGQDATTLKLSSSAAAANFASEHPESGVVTRSETPVCYV